ncbi:unnamed protein product [Prorocentrum cordatum]|uniref:Uncharacterized protein n=1 Tax=Prorocentrum cordatum TaxID=2364126 RepID=A0ABN9XDT0_9DINO|nr:unnamed protein product [Polarella glacialis]
MENRRADAPPSRKPTPDQSKRDTQMEENMSSEIWGHPAPPGHGGRQPPPRPCGMSAGQGAEGLGALGEVAPPAPPPDGQACTSPEIARANYGKTAMTMTKTESGTAGFGCGHRPSWPLSVRGSSSRVRDSWRGPMTKIGVDKAPRQLGAGPRASLLERSPRRAWPERAAGSEGQQGEEKQRPSAAAEMCMPQPAPAWVARGRKKSPPGHSRCMPT